MSAPLSAVKIWARGKKGENAGKDLSLGGGGGGQQGGRRRGGNMYGVGKTLQLDGRNANIESSLSSQDLIQDFSSWTWTLYVL